MDVVDPRVLFENYVYVSGTSPSFVAHFEAYAKDVMHRFHVPAGSFVTHYGKEIHYDGARDEDCVLQIVGMGPATSTPAEEK